MLKYSFLLPQSQRGGEGDTPDGKEGDHARIGRRDERYANFYASAIDRSDCGLKLILKWHVYATPRRDLHDKTQWVEFSFRLLADFVC